MKNNLQFLVFAIAACIILFFSCGSDTGTNCDQMAECFFVTHNATCDRDADGHPIEGTYQVTAIDTARFTYSVCDTAWAKNKFYQDIQDFDDQLGNDALSQFLKELDYCTCQPLPQ